METASLSFVDALENWPSVNFTLARLAEVAPHIEPRLYSIASSPLACNESVELCCGIVKYETEDGRLRHGLCSSMLARASSVFCKVREAPHMRLPEDPLVPIACVCGGTGLAPFLGFLEERAEQKRRGIEISRIAIYFGCRARYDELYGDRLRKWEEDAVCRLSVSYSRPQQNQPTGQSGWLPGWLAGWLQPTNQPARQREYVYDAMRRDADALRDLLCHPERGGDEDAGASPIGGRFYLCGSASGLAKDCTNVLAEILGCGDLAKGMSEVGRLQGTGRIIFDVWG